MFESAFLFSNAGLLKGKNRLGSAWSAGGGWAWGDLLAAAPDYGKAYEIKVITSTQAPIISNRPGWRNQIIIHLISSTQLF